jgi:chorismate--pyruvate lyase
LGTQAHWSSLEQVEARAPRELLSWLAEPGLLTARIRSLCGEGMRFRMLSPLRDAALNEALQARLGVADTRCLLRDVEFRCGDRRVVFAQTVLPASTLDHFPWLRDLGDAPIGELLRQASEPLTRDPLEYAALEGSEGLGRAALPEPAAASGPLWARRAVYRLGGYPILVQEVFLPALLQVQAEGASMAGHAP